LLVGLPQVHLNPVKSGLLKGKAGHRRDYTLANPFERERTIELHDCFLLRIRQTYLLGKRNALVARFAPPTCYYSKLAYACREGRRDDPFDNLE
jgi:hypothetical protein